MYDLISSGGLPKNMFGNKKSRETIEYSKLQH